MQLSKEATMFARNVPSPLRCALTMLVALAVHGAQAAQPPAEAGSGRCELGFVPARSVEDAVLTMSRCFLRSSIQEDREYIGAVLRTDRGYGFFVQRGKRGRDHAQLRLRRLRGQQLVAFWHTHGAPGWARHLFSPTDTGLVARTHLPLYLTDPAGAIRVYRPGDDRDGVTRVSRSALRLPRGAATGSRVGSRFRWRVSEPDSTSVAGDD
jgi:hypothetical protein